jgi:predicted amidohydrolase YtcJ
VASDKADLVLHEGVVMGHLGSDSVAIAGGRIAAHGPFAELKALVGPRTHLVRLAGRTVAPGFIDCHLHFFGAAAAAAGLQVSRCRTLGELLTELRIAAGRTPPGNWIKAFGCDEELLRERRGPTRKELDEVTPRNPLRLRHQTLHASWLNSRAIASLGLERPDFVPPQGARLPRDDSGRLSGLAIGMEQWLTRRLPRVTGAGLEARTRAFSRELAAAGVTAFTDATVRNGPDEVSTFAKLVREGALCPSYEELLADAARMLAMLEAMTGTLTALATARRSAGAEGSSVPAAARCISMTFSMGSRFSANPSNGPTCAACSALVR